MLFKCSTWDTPQVKQPSNLEESKPQKHNKERFCSISYQSWQPGHGPAILKHISNTSVRNHRARHCKPGCNSELRLLPPYRPEVISHFRSQVKRDISSIWNVKHLKAAQHNRQRIKLGSFIGWVSFMCFWMHWNGLTSYRTSTSEQLFVALLETEKLLLQFPMSRFLHSVCDIAHQPCKK